MLKEESIRKDKGQQPKKQLAQNVDSSAKVDGLASMLATAFSMISTFSTNTTSCIGWYVDKGASRHMRYNYNLFIKLHEKEMDVQVALGVDTTTYWSWHNTNQDAFEG